MTERVTGSPGCEVLHRIRSDDEMTEIERINNDAVVAAWGGDIPAVERLREEASRIGSPEGAALATLLQASVYYYRGQYSDALVPAEQGLAAAEACGSAPLIASAHNKIGAALLGLGDAVSALAHFQRAYELYVELGDIDHAMSLMSNQGNAHLGLNNFDEALRWFEMARQACESRGAIDKVGTVYMHIGIALTTKGSTDEALASYHRALEAQNQAGNRREVATVTEHMANLYATIGDLTSALRCYHSALQINEEIGYPTGMANVLNALSILHMRIGEYPRALECLTRAKSLFLELQQEIGIRMAEVNIGTVYHACGDIEHALQSYRKVLEHTDPKSAPVSYAHCLLNIGTILAEQRDDDQALEYLTQALALYTKAQHTAEIAMGTQALVLLHLQRNDLPAAEELLASLRNMRHMEPEVRIGILAAEARLSELREDLDAAQHSLTSALEMARQFTGRRVEADLHRQLRDLAEQRSDLKGYVEHNNAFTSITEEIRGSQASQRLAMINAEQMMMAERQERERERAVLYSTLPKEVADRMIRGEQVKGDHYNEAAILFADIVGFTTHASNMTPSEVPVFLEDLYRRFDEICARYGVTKIKTIGDSYLCFKGSATATENALAVAHVARALQQIEVFWPDTNPQERLQLRIGAHAGPVTAGVIGTERLQYDVWGDTVNVASRMESHGEPGRIHVSEAFASALDPGLRRGDEGMDPGFRRGDERTAGSDDDSRTAHRPPLTENDSLTSDSLTLFKRGLIDVKGKGPMTTYWLEGA
jgi:class 3 adenylate cyclase/Tfp pilus assembly protein PilF